MVNCGLVVITIFLLPLLLDRWTDGQQKDKRTDKQKNRWTDGKRMMDGRTTDGRTTDGQTEGRKDGGETDGLRTDHTLFLPRILAAWLTSPGGLNILFSALNVVQRPQHCFLAKLWHRNDAFDENKGVWGS